MARNRGCRGLCSLPGSGAEPQQSPETESLAGQGQSPCNEKKKKADE